MLVRSHSSGAPTRAVAQQRSAAPAAGGGRRRAACCALGTPGAKQPGSAPPYSSSSWRSRVAHAHASSGGPSKAPPRGEALVPAAAAGGGPPADAPVALLLEVDGALCDLVMDGHRVAFNDAFHDLGLDCTSWTAPLFNDLMSHSDGTGEGLVAAYFSRIGWPLTVGKGEEDTFAGRVHAIKQQHLTRRLRGGGIPLRSGVEQVLRDAVAAGARIALLTETASTPSEDVAAACLSQLDPSLAGSVRVYSAGLHRPPGEEEDEGAAAGEDREGGGGGGGDAFRAAAARVQQRAAAEFLSRLGRDAPENAARVGVASSLLAPNAPRVAPEWLAAVAATLGVPAARCICVASSGALVAAAAQAGMLAVAVPRQGALAAAYDTAAAKFEGFGPGAATYPRLAAQLGKVGGAGAGRR